MNDSGAPISLMQATWTVPPAPADISDQTVFLFPGIENLSGDVGVLQPVLQWGVSQIGGGPYWTAANWYVPTTGEAFHSDLIRVDPGQALTGVMRLVPAPPGQAQPAGTYYYDSEFIGVAGTDLATGDLPELTWAILTLEAYRVANRNQYPATATTACSAVDLVAAASLARVKWVPIVRTGAFGEGVDPVSDAVPGGMIDIAY